MKPMKRAFLAVVVQALVLLLPLSGTPGAPRPLCIPVEYKTSPFFLHFKGTGAPTLVVVHGGFSSTKRSALFCQKFAQVFGERYNVVSVDYRFSSIGGGEMVDLLRGIQLARERLGTPPRRIFIMGASHGAYLALMAGAKVQVGGVVDGYGPTYWPMQLEYVKKFRPRVFKKWRIYMAISRGACREAGLKFHQCLVERSVITPANLKGLDEPVLILHGKKDRLVPVEESRRLARKLREQGRDVTFKVFGDKGHGFPLWEGEPLEAIKRFLGKRAARG